MAMAVRRRHSSRQRRIVSEGACEQIDSLRRKAFYAFKNFEVVIGILSYLSLAELAGERKR